MLLDLQVVRSAAQCDKGSCDDVHETPGEVTERCRVSFAGELTSDPGGHLRNPAKTPNGIIACRVIRPAQVEHIEFVQASGAFGFQIHAFEQIGIALRVEDDDDLVLAVLFSPDVLSDEQFSQGRFSDTGGTQNNRMAYPLTQRERDVLLVWLDAVQPWQAADGWQRSHWIDGHVP
ncbi:hypothetical protein ALQ30_200154 [Pseudomonas syringae pv. persicae]|uniref:Uncharacterized protein n=1 Tax=Pseudomonas syringae pv. persicae TaxID=237306 RepID=A0A3M4B5H3_9PSED|nr:hypothetical protein ALQ30_200154 [Pseudomonas syringae pv. persicae]